MKRTRISFKEPLTQTQALTLINQTPSENMFSRSITYRSSLTLTMGGVQSVSDDESSLEVFDNSNQSATRLFRLYSREFERDQPERAPAAIDRAALYLDDYGDDVEPEEPVIVETPVREEPVEDDDYPIDTVSANFDSNPQPGTPNSSIMESFENARSQSQSDLDDIYPKLPSESNSRCESERSELMKCHKESEDVLHCRQLVDNYFQCAKRASEDLLRDRNYVHAKQFSTVPNRPEIL